jgi:hypothetical protein
MPNYGRWLPGSNAFGGTTDVKPYPVRLGTTILTRDRRARDLALSRSMILRSTSPFVLKKDSSTADIAVDIRYTFEPQGHGTFVNR